MQVRCLLERVPVDDILGDWHGLLAHYMQQWQLDRSEVGAELVFPSKWCRCNVTFGEEYPINAAACRFGDVV